MKWTGIVMRSSFLCWTLAGIAFAQGGVILLQEDEPSPFMNNLMRVTNSNFTRSNRNRGDIDAIVLHGLEGLGVVNYVHMSQQRGGLRTFSVHYFVFASGGVWCLVQPKNIAHHAGLPFTPPGSGRSWNGRSIGIACELTPNHTWYEGNGTPTPQMKSLIRLVRMLCEEYRIKRVHRPEMSFKATAKGTLDFRSGEAGIVGHHQLMPHGVYEHPLFQIKQDPDTPGPRPSILFDSHDIGEVFPWVPFMEDVRKPLSPSHLAPGTTNRNSPPIVGRTVSFIWRYRSPVDVLTDQLFQIRGWELEIRKKNQRTGSWEPYATHLGQGNAPFATTINEGTYNWRVRGVSIGGLRGFWSARHYFHCIASVPEVWFNFSNTGAPNTPIQLFRGASLGWTYLGTYVETVKITLMQYRRTGQTGAWVIVSEATRPFSAGNTWTVPNELAPGGSYVVFVDAWNPRGWNPRHAGNRAYFSVIR